MVRLPNPLSVLLLAAACVAPPPAPSLLSVEPNQLLAAQGGPVTLRGAGLLPVGMLDFDRPSQSTLRAPVEARLRRADLVVELAEVTWVDARTVTATVPPGLELGAWTVELTAPRGLQLSLTDGLELVTVLPDGGTDDGGTDDGGTDDGGTDDGGVDSGVFPCADFTFQDSDDDGFGAPDSGALLCGPGRVLVDGDCNDVDSLSSPLGREICNGLDDDCDGLVDEVGCFDGGVAFTRITTLDAPENDFRSASAWTSDSLWIAGDSHLFVRTPDAGFVRSENNCPTNMNAVWADPSGRAFVAGGNNGVGRLTTATRGAGCVTAQLIPDPVAGLWGYVTTDGGVFVETVLRDGRRVRWDGAAPVQVWGSSVPNVTLLDAHGAVPGSAFAVGSSNGTPQRPVVVRFQPDGGFVNEPLPTQGVPNGALYGVWALSPTEAVAVGDDGLVLRRVRGRWEVIPPPSMYRYTTVRAFSIGRFYLSTEFGYLRQWSGRWALAYTDMTPVRDLTAFDEEHFWLVGDNGFIVRTQPP